MKKIIMSVLFMISLLGLYGCVFNGGQTINDDFDLVVDDPTALSGTVKIALPSAGGKRVILEAVIEEYRKQRPNVTVQVEWKASDDFYLSYQIDVSTGLVFPDVAFIDHVYIQSLAALNLIIPVNQSINQVKDQYIDNLVNATALDGKLYGYPFSANTLALFYNKDILGNRSVPTTYQEFIEVGTSIHQQEQSKPVEQRNQVFSLSTGADYKNFGALIFVSWLSRLNGQMLSADLQTSYINQEPTKQVLTLWKDIIDRGWANPALSNEGLFYVGKVAFLEMGNWIIPTVFGDNAKSNFGVAPLFSLTENGEKNSALGLYALCVTRQSDENRMRLAADLSQFISTNTQVQIDYAKNANLLPVTKEAAQDVFFQQDAWKVFIDALPLAALRPGSPEWPTIQDEIGNMFMKVVLGRETITNAVNDAHNKVQRRLDDFYKG